jgi:hypothetical protein
MRNGETITGQRMIVGAHGGGEPPNRLGRPISTLCARKALGSSTLYHLTSILSSPDSGQHPLFLPTTGTLDRYPVRTPPHHRPSLPGLPTHRLEPSTYALSRSILASQLKIFPSHTADVPKSGIRKETKQRTNKIIDSVYLPLSTAHNQ